MESFNIKFVGEVEKHPELYNYTLREYSKKDATEKAWNMVGKKVKLTVAECKEKWRNLRSTFVKNLKPKLSGSGTSKKRPYYLMDAMQFTIPFVKVVGNPSGNLPETSQRSPSPTSSPDDFEMEIKEENLPADEIIPEPEFPATVQNPPPPSADVHTTTTATPPVRSLPVTSRSSSPSQGDRATPPPDPLDRGTRGPHGQPVRKRKLLSNFQSDADKAFTDYFSAKTAKLSNPPPPKDQRDKREEGIRNFVNSLIPDLMQMNDVQLRKYKRQALLLIDEVTGTSPEILSSESLASPSYQRSVIFPADPFNVPTRRNFSILTASSGSQQPANDLEQPGSSESPIIVQHL